MYIYIYDRNQVRPNTTADVMDDGLRALKFADQ